jgi:hypothetical protein
MITMTEEQRFLFDLNGFLVIENVLDLETCERLKHQIHLMRHDPERLPIEKRQVPGGALADLIDHPVIEPLLHEFIGPRLRLDYGFVIWRQHGQRHPMDLHHGGPVPEPMFHYNFRGGRIWSGLMRVVFELNDVNPGDGGTCFLPGSHKSNFHVPERLRNLDGADRSPFLYEASVKAGSAILFSENTAHGGPVWQNREWPRVAVFYSYIHRGMRFHKPNFSPEAIASLNPKRRAYFNDVWVHDFETDTDNE